MPRRSMHQIVAEEDANAIARQRCYRQVADLTARAWADLPGVEAIGVTGGVAGKLWREMPYWRRRGAPSLHSVGRLEMVLRLSRTDQLNRLRRAFGVVLKDAAAQGIQHAMADFYLFGIVFDVRTDAYRGVICTYNACPKGKPGCAVPGCGDVAFLRRFPDYGAADAKRDMETAAMLFVRGEGFVGSALDLPQTAPDEELDEA